MARKRVGELLVERKAISPEQLSAALAYQRERGGRLGQALIAKGYLTEPALCRVLGEALGLPVAERVRLRDMDALALLRGSFCERHALFPVAAEGRGSYRRLTVAMADPLDLAAIEQIESTTGCKVEPVLAPRAEIREAVARHYHLDRGSDIGPLPDSTGRMVLVRPGGGEETVDTRPVGRDIPPPLLPYPPPEEVLPLTDEVTRRTDLAEFIRDRERRQASRTAPGSPAAQIEELDHRLWALVRLLARKGLITREEFLEELDG